MNKQIYKNNLSLRRNSVVTLAGIGIILLSLLGGAAGCTEKKATSGAESSSEAVAERIKPIGKIDVVEATEAEHTASISKEEAQSKPAAKAQTTDSANEKPSLADNGKENPLARGKVVVENNCAPCHGGNLPGAPVLGNPADWTTRLAQGKETLVAHVINGYNAMPPKGGNPSLSNEDITAAVDYIISRVEQ